MELYIMTYVIHWLMALFFFLLLPFPFILKGVNGEQKFWLLNVYRWIFHLSHAGVIISLASGVMLADTYLSSWFFAVMILWLVISAMLGFTAKYARIIREGGAVSVIEERRLFWFSLALSAAVFLMFVVKFAPWITGDLT
ncbi:hypothetical protein B0H94_101226 [Salsuginibacillus halophilus]|uniref:Uncharacterized protein n=1 Tax=Salsuginibacillus halophilus TaxID=517424 RepID=A0A2P8HYN7_9BACI|nr:hypothetical protein [Salsuginibacillus halophilus]PSL51313.1 hypothetical protein B0H94_101226 [Salsuginibacillus halophilus]